MFTLKRLSVTALGAALSLAAITALADPDPLNGYQEDWENGDAGDAGWSSTGGSCVARDTDGDNGYLEIAHCEGSGGAAYDGAELTGDFSGTVWTFAADLRCFAGSCAEASLRFYESDTDGWWEYELADEVLEGWETFAVMFDPSWSSEDAQDAGWLPGTDTSFSEVMSNVGSTQLLISGAPPFEGYLTAGMDNVTLSVGTDVTVTLNEGENHFDLGFVQVDVNVRDAGTERYQFCVAEVPDGLQGRLFPANLLKYTGTCGDFDLGGWVPPTVRFFRDEADNKLKVGVMRVDSDATYDGLYQQVLTESFLSQAPLGCLRYGSPADQPLTYVFDFEDFGSLYNNSTAECNQPISLGRKRSTYLSPVYRVPNVGVAIVAVGARLASLYVQLYRADLAPSVKSAILAELNAASKNFLKKRFVNLIANFEQIARIAANADETNDEENWLGLFWGQGLIGAFETSEGVLGQVYNIPSGLEPFPEIVIP